tara:strand:+ start:858 stop:1514 length:657 start_codon:yes stop_codon:yes gene_type:complete
MSEVASNAEIKGFTGSEATKRLRERVGKVQIQFLALSIMAKMKGKTNKAIRNDLGDNCPSWISKIFTMADKAMAHIEIERQNEISRMTVAKAEEAVVARIEAHMTALGLGGFEAYGKVCHFAAECDASKAVLNPPKDEKPEEEKPAEPEVEPVNTAINEPIVSEADRAGVILDTIRMGGFSAETLRTLTAALAHMAMEAEQTAALMPEAEPEYMAEAA